MNKSSTSLFPPGSPWTNPEALTGSNESRYNDAEIPTSRNFVMAYIVLFVIAATGNLSVFFSVLQQLRKTKSRMCLLILHLSMADLMVTFFVMPNKIFRRYVIGWYGGNILCKIYHFLWAFGQYLSTMVLICISMDRYFAIIHPLRMMSGAKRHLRTMLATAWIVSALCSLPRIFIFRTRTHPDDPSFTQCTSFISHEELVVYVFSFVLIMYILPLPIIIFTYSRILYKLVRRSRQQDDPREGEGNGEIQLRRCGEGNLERAKSRTLRLTLIIIVVFLLCWTPYTVMGLWYMFDMESAVELNYDVQEGLFIMTLANSCLNPLVYGLHQMECHTTVLHYCCYETRPHPEAEATPLNVISKPGEEMQPSFGTRAVTTCLWKQPEAQDRSNIASDFLSFV